MGKTGHIGAFGKNCYYPNTTNEERKKTGIAGGIVPSTVPTFGSKLELRHYYLAIFWRNVKYIESLVSAPTSLVNESTYVVQDVINTSFIIAFPSLLFEFHHQRHILHPRFVVLLYPLYLSGDVLGELALGSFSINIGEELVDVLVHFVNRAFGVQENLDSFVTKLQAVLFVAKIGEGIHLVAIAREGVECAYEDL